jgi:uncharacterized SAM-binding protein YcdF (DUF218 family)
MFYVVSKLLWPFVQPSNLLLLLLLLAVLLLWRGQRRLGGPLLGVASGALLLVGVLPVGQWLLLPLENRFPVPADLPARIDGVVMLGGVMDPKIAEARGIVAFDEPGERATTLLALARRYPDARLVVSAGGEPLSEAQILLPFFRDQGLPPERILFEDRALNTWQNAVFSKALARPAPGEHWLLVTSAAHMPRAVGCFEQAGWPVIAYPVDYRTTGRFVPLTALDVARRLGEFDGALKAWIGLAAYRLSGRIPELLPGP